MACTVQSAGMHGESVPEAAVWLGMVGAYVWSVRSLARLGWEHDGDCPAEASDDVGEHRLRVAGSTPSVENRPAVAPVAVARQTETRIADLLTAELVVSALEAGGRDDVMNALATRVAACHPQVDAGRLVEALREREGQMTTALVDGVAIPHARLDGLDRTVAVFARSVNGIRWESLDGEPTRLIFLLAGPADLPGAYLKVLAGASRLLSGARCRARLLEATGDAELLAVLREEEDRSFRTARAA